MLGATLSGSAFGAAVAGAVLALEKAFSFRLPGSAAALGAGVFCLLYGLSSLGFLRLPLPPQRHSQVPHGWRLSMTPRQMGFWYGLGLGVGVATFVRVLSFYAVLLWCALTADPLRAAIVMGLFGAGRGLPILVIASRAESIDHSLGVMKRLRAVTRYVRLADGVVMSMAALMLIGLAVRS